MINFNVSILLKAI